MVEEATRKMGKRLKCAICDSAITKEQPMLYMGAGTAKDAVHIRCLARVAMEDGLVICIDHKSTVKAEGVA